MGLQSLARWENPFWPLGWQRSHSLLLYYTSAFGINRIYFLSCKCVMKERGQRQRYRETQRERQRERLHGYSTNNRKECPIRIVFKLETEPHLSPLKIILWPFAFSRPYVFWQRPESRGTSGRVRAEGCLAQVPGAKKYTCQKSSRQIQREESTGTWRAGCGPPSLSVAD